jgi:hypothetical protein
MLDSCGNSWTGETPEAQPRRLTASPAESEHPVAEINYYFLLYNSNKLYEKSLVKKKSSLFNNRKLFFIYIKWR